MAGDASVVVVMAEVMKPTRAHGPSAPRLAARALSSPRQTAHAVTASHAAGEAHADAVMASIIASESRKVPAQLPRPSSGLSATDFCGIMPSPHKSPQTWGLSTPSPHN